MSGGDPQTFNRLRAKKGERTMLVTNAEAVTKYCPFQFASGIGAKTCFNVECMAWKRYGRIPTTREEMGYCGLAGEPSQEERTNP